MPQPIRLGDGRYQCALCSHVPFTPSNYAQHEKQYYGKGVSCALKWPLERQQQGLQLGSCNATSMQAAARSDLPAAATRQQPLHAPRSLPRRGTGSELDAEEDEERSMPASTFSSELYVWARMALAGQGVSDRDLQDLLTIIANYDPVKEPLQFTNLQQFKAREEQALAARGMKYVAHKIVIGNEQVGASSSRWAHQRHACQAAGACATCPSVDSRRPRICVRCTQAPHLFEPDDEPYVTTFYALPAMEWLVSEFSKPEYQGFFTLKAAPQYNAAGER
jgi:hypothetical protein